MSEELKTTIEDTENKATDTPVSEQESTPEVSEPEATTPVNETAEEKKSSGNFFSRFKKDKWHDTRDGWILTHLQQEDIMEYLRMENEREKLYLKERETRNKRIMIAFMTTICLIAGVIIVHLLKDNPTILLSVLYIAGILIFVRYWKQKS